MRTQYDLANIKNSKQDNIMLNLDTAHCAHQAKYLKHAHRVCANDGSYVTIKETTLLDQF